ncbi:MAG: RAMP superfamily CRISPR-associated protein [Candidatus Hadarchaeales archaeon]
MPDYRDFDKLKSLTKIRGILINHTPLRVGTGREASLEAAVDIAVFRVGEVACIPGSSLKGVLRATAEILAPSFGITPHPPWDLPKAEKEGDFCEICGIFGNQELMSHIKVYDAYPQGEAPIFVKPGVAIDRNFGSVAHGPFFEELVVPGCRWDFRVDIINIPVFEENTDKRGKILETLFRMFRTTGLHVGARSTVGSGLTVLEDLNYATYTLTEKGFVLKKEGRVQ